jgi:hypothetical protein
MKLSLDLKITGEASAHPYSTPPPPRYAYVRSKHSTSANLRTPYSRVLLEELTGFAASQEIPRILCNPKVRCTFTSAHHLSLS